MEVELTWEERSVLDQLINDELLDMESGRSHYAGNVDREATLKSTFEKIRIDR